MIERTVQIGPHIYLVGSGEIGISEDHDCHVYLVDAGQCYVLIDCGAGIEQTLLIGNLSRLLSHGKPLSYILLTHCHPDHAGGASALRSKYQARLGCGELTAKRVASGVSSELSLDAAVAEGIYPADYSFSFLSADEILRNGQAFRAGDVLFKALETPGHSADSVCYLAEFPEGKALFSGDTLHAGGMLQLLNTHDSDLAAYRKSIARLNDISFDLLCPGHGLFLVSGAHQVVERLARKLSSSIFLPPVFTA